MNAVEQHVLAQAVEVEFGEVFPGEYTTALCDQLWLRLALSQQRSAIGDNPWHDWGWFRDGPLSEQLVDDEADQQREAIDYRRLGIINLCLRQFSPRNYISHRLAPTWSRARA